MEYKLGKLPAKADKRNIKLKSIIKKALLPELPEVYSVDRALNGVNDENMYANDRYGCCVISARAHQTLRFEKYEQDKLITITDLEVIQQYFEESGGFDTGLYLLESLKSWRKSGWIINGSFYNIYAFAEVDFKDHDEVKHCIHLLGGVNYGFLVPQSALDQFEAGEDWKIVQDDGGIKGGHGVYAYAYGYDNEGLYCMTWGRRQKLSWDFWDKYTDEAYGIVDNRNDWLPDSPLDVEKLDGYLCEITQDNTDEEPTGCCIARAIKKLWRRLNERLH
jgi:hypothetical protein